MPLPRSFLIVISLAINFSWLVIPPTFVLAGDANGVARSVLRNVITSASVLFQMSTNVCDQALPKIPLLSSVSE